MYSYEYALVVYNNKRFSTHVLSVSLSSLNSLSQFLSSIYFNTQHFIAGFLSPSKASGANIVNFVCL